MASEADWRRARLRSLVHLTSIAPPNLRWTVSPDGKLLKTPRGVLWELRLKHGAWIRRHPTPDTPV